MQVITSNNASENLGNMRTYTSVEQLARIGGFLSDVEHLALHTLQEQLEWGDVHFDRDHPGSIVGLRLGEVLVSNGVISSAVRDTAMSRAQTSGRRFGEELLDMNAFTEMDLAFWLKMQQRLIGAARKVLAGRIR